MSAMNDHRPPFAWEPNLRELIGEEKVRRLHRKVLGVRRQRRQFIYRVLAMFGLGPLLIVGGLWALSTLPTATKADYANGIIALLLAGWAFVKHDIPSLTADEINTVAGEIIPGVYTRQIIEDAHTGAGAARLPDIERLAPFMGALWIGVVLFLKHQGF